MKISRKAGTTSEILQIFIRDSSSTTGAGLTGLTNASSGLTAYYCRNDQNAPVSISVVSMTLGTYTSGGFKEIDSANMPGWYQFCPPNGVFTSGRSAAIHLKGVTNMAPLPIEVEITAVDNQSATAFITGVNSLAPPANWNTDIVQSGDAYARLGAPAGASTAADIASVKTDTGTTLPATLATIAGYIDTEVAAIKAKTDNLPASPAAVGSAMTLTAGERTSVADALLARNIKGGSSAGRIVSDALAFIRNRWVISGGTLTVYDTDDATILWTAAVTGTAGADPITGTDPA